MAFDLGGLVGGIIQGAGSILSPILGYASARKTNESNERIASQTNQANAQSVSETNEMNRQIAEQTNATNRAIADQNLGFQRELQEYNKALQERIFEREDTSYQRTAQDMLAAGLNPLDMQGTNGAGEIISQTPLNNDYQAQIGASMQARHDERYEQADAFQSALSAVGAYASVMQGIDSVLSARLNRDSIQLDNDKKKLENAILAHDYGVQLFGKGRDKFVGTNELSFNPSSWTKTEGWKNYDNEKLMREFEHMKTVGIYDTDTDFERILTALSDWVNNGRGEEEWKKLEKTFPVLKAFSTFGGNK